VFQIKAIGFIQAGTKLSFRRGGGIVTGVVGAMFTKTYQYGFRRTQKHQIKVELEEKSTRDRFVYATINIGDLAQVLDHFETPDKLSQATIEAIKRCVSAVVKDVSH
jgi:hypothetical protein